MIGEKEGLITFMGREKVGMLKNDDIYPIAVYTVDEKERLCIGKVNKIKKIKKYKGNILNIQTKGRRGNIIGGEDLKLKVKKEGDGYEWLSISDIREGDELLGFVESIVSYEMGIKAPSSFTVDSVDKVDSGCVYDIDVEENNLIINNLVVSL